MIMEEQNRNLFTLCSKYRPCSPQDLLQVAVFRKHIKDLPADQKPRHQISDNDDCVAGTNTMTDLQKNKKHLLRVADWNEKSALITSIPDGALVKKCES